MSKKYISLDTNIFISFLTRRNEEQFEIANSFFQEINLGQIEVFLPSVIVGEIFYILLKIYEFPKESICQSLQSIINLPNIITDDKEIMLLTVEKYSILNLDFADCYLLSINELKKYKLETFDKKLKNQIGKSSM
jgi:predicted nucleic-acid-binding protein